LEPSQIKQVSLSLLLLNWAKANQVLNLIIHFIGVPKTLLFTEWFRGYFVFPLLTQLLWASCQTCRVAFFVFWAVYCYYFFLVTLGVELTALYLSHTSDTFTLVSFETGSCFIPQLAWDTSFLFYLFLRSWSDRNTPLHWSIWGLVNFLPRVGLNHDAPDLHLPKS
jgi:hypothetical protein